MYGEEFLQEHDFNERVLPGEEEGSYLNSRSSNIQRFKETLDRRLVPTTDEKSMVQAVVMAALETEQLKIDRPEIIVEALLCNPEKRAEAVAYYESLLKKNIQ